MKLKKVAKSYNDYNLELSWGQLQAVKTALEAGPVDPVVDELLAEWNWYMDNVPGPGEDEDEFKAREEGPDGETGGGEDDGDVPIPMPPREDGEYRETVAGEGPSDDGEGAEPGDEQDSTGDGGEAPGTFADLPEPGGEEEEALPAPPSE